MLLCLLSVCSSASLEQLDHGLPGLSHSNPLHWGDTAESGVQLHGNYQNIFRKAYLIFLQKYFFAVPNFIIILSIAALPGTPICSSMKRTYFWALPGSSSKVLAADVSLFQPGSVSYTTSTRCRTSWLASSGAMEGEEQRKHTMTQLGSKVN